MRRMDNSTCEPLQSMYPQNPLITNIRRLELESITLEMAAIRRTTQGARSRMGPCYILSTGRLTKIGIM